MGHHTDINKISIIQDALIDYKGLTSGEKQYCTENLSSWIGEDNSLDTLIAKFAEKSLDIRPFLQQIDLVV